MPDADRLRTLFNLFDRDGSGTLDAEELLEILTRGSDGLSLADAKEIVDSFDENKDGVLSVDEFVKAMSAVGGELPSEPAVGEYVKITSGKYKGRVGVVTALPDLAAMVKKADDADNEGIPVAYTVNFLDGAAGRATVTEKLVPVHQANSLAEMLTQYGFTALGTLEVISKAELDGVVTADRAKRDAQRKALDAAQEAELQVEWEAKGKTGRVPRVGADRTSPIAPEWWDLPWFDAWVAGGCDHQLLGITVEGIERLLEDWTGNTDGGYAEEDFRGTFQRSVHPGLEWVTEAFGREEDTGPIGYDLGHFVRIWDMVRRLERAACPPRLARSDLADPRTLMVNSDPCSDGAAHARAFAGEWRHGQIGARGHPHSPQEVHDPGNQLWVYPKGTPKFTNNKAQQGAQRLGVALAHVRLHQVGDESLRMDEGADG